MGTIYSFEPNIKDKITSFKLDLIKTNNLLKAHVESLKLTMERHSDQQTIDIITSNMKIFELKSTMIERVIVQLDNILFQITVGVDDNTLFELLKGLIELIEECNKTVYVKQLDDFFLIYKDVNNFYHPPSKGHV
jgi:hypothetical protein